MLTRDFFDIFHVNPSRSENTNESKAQRKKRTCAAVNVVVGEATQAGADQVHTCAIPVRALCAARAARSKSRGRNTLSIRRYFVVWTN